MAKGTGCGLAYPNEPPGYWMEIIKRGEGVAARPASDPDLGRPVLCQTMIRVKVGELVPCVPPLSCSTPGLPCLQT